MGLPVVLRRSGTGIRLMIRAWMVARPGLPARAGERSAPCSGRQRWEHAPPCPPRRSNGLRMLLRPRVARGVAPSRRALHHIAGWRSVLSSGGGGGGGSFCCCLLGLEGLPAEQVGLQLRHQLRLHRRQQLAQILRRAVSERGWGIREVGRNTQQFGRFSCNSC